MESASASKRQRVVIKRMDARSICLLGKRQKYLISERRTTYTHTTKDKSEVVKVSRAYIKLTKSHQAESMEISRAEESCAERCYLLCLEENKTIGSQIQSSCMHPPPAVTAGQIVTINAPRRVPSQGYTALLLVVEGERSSGGHLAIILTSALHVCNIWATRTLADCMTKRVVPFLQATTWSILEPKLLIRMTLIQEGRCRWLFDFRKFDHRFHRLFNNRLLRFFR